jgi:hypothetical protein
MRLLRLILPYLFVFGCNLSTGWKKSDEPDYIGGGLFVAVPVSFTLLTIYFWIDHLISLPYETGRLIAAAIFTSGIIGTNLIFRGKFHTLSGKIDDLQESELNFVEISSGMFFILSFAAMVFSAFYIRNHMPIVVLAA